MRILMAATGDFAVPTFNALPDAGHEILGLITQPDRPAGRGRHLRPSAIKQAALDRCIPVMQPEKIAARDMVDQIADLAPEVFLVIAYGQKIPAEICRLPPKGAINMHGSLLPALRGAAPCNWAIIHGFRETGVTVQFLAQTMDAGDILGMRRTAIGPRETAPQLHDRLAVLGVDVVLEVLRRLDDGSAQPVPQDESQVTYAPRLKKEDGLIDWTLDAGRLDALVRGLKPWPGAYTYLTHAGKPDLRVIVEEAVECPLPAGVTAAPGTVIESQKRLVVAAGSGALEIVQLKPESSKTMTGVAFGNGHQVRPGDRFGRSRD